MVTVEADPVSVESRLASRQLACPVCPGVLRPWGWARPRRVHGVAGVVRPRRVRCAGCLVTQVLLPVTVLVRRAYGAATIVAALAARATGSGHRGIAAGMAVPAGTVRGWLRRMSGRLEPVRVVFLAVASAAGVDQPAPIGAGSSWADTIAALGAATAALRARFGAAGPVGVVTPAVVAAACSGGRLLSPGWPDAGAAGFATRVVPAG